MEIQRKGGLYEKLKRMWDTGGGSFTGTNLAKSCLRCKSGIIKSKSGKLVLVLNSLALRKNEL